MLVDNIDHLWKPLRRNMLVQTELVEVAGKCENEYRLNSPLQMYSGDHAPTLKHFMLHIALQSVAYLAY